MAHFAELDENNNVTQVIVVHNNDLVIDGWVQTSYSGNMRKQFAGIGMKYDSEIDEFVESITRPPSTTP